MEEDNGLFPAADLPEFEEEEDSYDSEYRPSFAWDLEKGDFVLTKSHGLSQSEGIEAYKTWCVKTAVTQRGSCLAYDDDIGVDMEEALAEENEDAVELAIERTIEEALMVNPRTESVEDFEFTWGPDFLHVKFLVTAAGYGEFPVETDLDIDRQGKS